jgi:cyanophycinase
MIAYGDQGPTPRSDMVTLATGLGLSRRMIIDQHFRQRDRLGRLLSAISYNPRLIGMGVDEDTAAFIDPDRVFEVIGSGAVTVVDGSDVEHLSMDSVREDSPVSVIGLRVHVLVEGGTFDLESRQARPQPVGAKG